MTAKTPSERMKDMRDRIKNSGGKTVSVSIPPDLNRLIEQMLRDEQSGHKNIAAIIRAGIRTAYANYLEPDLISDKSKACIAAIQKRLQMSKREIIEQALSDLDDSTDCDEQNDDEEIDPQPQPQQDEQVAPWHRDPQPAQKSFEETEDTLEFK